MGFLLRFTNILKQRLFSLHAALPAVPKLYIVAIDFAFAPPTTKPNPRGYACLGGERESEVEKYKILDIRQFACPRRTNDIGKPLS